MRAVYRRLDRHDWWQGGGDWLCRDRTLGCLVRLTNGPGLVASLQDEAHDVGTVVVGAELRSRKEVGLLLPAAIDVPADQILAAGGGHVIAGRRPDDPFAALRLNEQSKQLLAV